ncbi:MAG: transposase [Phycisphaeraceae bacterium]|nr:transposase [Phycisphaeraceae bacterium]
MNTSAKSPMDSLPDDVALLKAMLLQRESFYQTQHIERETFYQTQLAQQQTSLALREAQLTEQLSTIQQLQREKEGLSHRLDWALSRIYGRSSERIDPRQLLLFGQLMQEAAAAMEKLAALQEHNTPENKAKTSGGSGSGGKGHGRRALPANLPRHRVEHAVSAEELLCPCCGKARDRIGEDIAEQLDYTPASLFVIEHVRPKFACHHCKDSGVARAEKSLENHPGVIDKGLPGPGLVAHVITSKYADHLPLYRMEGILKRHGVELARSTMCGWMKASADLLDRLVGLMADKVRQSKVIHTDDTPMEVLPPKNPRKNKSRPPEINPPPGSKPPETLENKGKINGTQTGRMWVYLGDESHPYIVYDYTPTRQGKGPALWLKNFKGYLQADAYSGYDALYDNADASEESEVPGAGVIEVACWAHARRKVYDARHSAPEQSHYALAMVRLLYDVEKQAKALDAEKRRELRQKLAGPLLAELKQWLDEQQSIALPKSPLGTAINYALNNWQALIRYVDDGDLAIDNNAAERAIRPLTVGRKNYLFLGSDNGGRTAATLYSLTASAKRHGLDPFIYLRDVLATFNQTSTGQLEQFLPDIWRQNQLKQLANLENQNPT